MGPARVASIRDNTLLKHTNSGDLYSIKIEVIFDLMREYIKRDH